MSQAALPPLSDDDDDLGISLPKPAAAKKVVNLDDDDDDLLPPPAATASPAAKPAVVLDEDDDEDMSPPPPTKPPAVQTAPPAAAAIPSATAAAPASPRHVGPASPTAVTRRQRSETATNRVRIEGWLEKQMPYWPYSFKRRFCFIRGTTFSYYESPPQPGQEPLGHLELKNAHVTRDCAKKPFSFGISGPQLTHKKDATTRMYVFAASTKNDMNAWISTVENVVSDSASQELHWFEKMSQGLF